VVVHVAGAVANPGIVELVAGSRVAYAVDQAGGALPEADLSAINLARVLVDGEQVLIPLIGQQVSAPEPEPYVPQLDLTQVPDAEGHINLNQAGSELLQQLPGIGPALAGRIIEYRNQVGGFGSVDQLQEVSGIGPSVMNNVRDKVAV
jgi:competence protein ComEA